MDDLAGATPENWYPRKTGMNPEATINDDRRFGGVTRLFGSDGAASLRRARICVVGIGGVGSWALEALARTGVGYLTAVDLDMVAESNTNRQIHALDGKGRLLVLEVFHHLLFHRHVQLFVNGGKMTAFELVINVTVNQGVVIALILVADALLAVAAAGRVEAAPHTDVHPALAVHVDLLLALPVLEAQFVIAFATRAGSGF